DQSEEMDLSGDVEMVDVERVAGGDPKPAVISTPVTVTVPAESTGEEPDDADAAGGGPGAAMGAPVKEGLKVRGVLVPDQRLGELAGLLGSLLELKALGPDGDPETVLSTQPDKGWAVRLQVYDWRRLEQGEVVWEKIRAVLGFDFDPDVGKDLPADAVAITRVRVPLETVDALKP